MKGKRFLAVTQLGLNLRLSEDGAPIRHTLQALLLDPADGWRVQRLDLSYPGFKDGAETGEFLVSAVGDLDGDGRSEIVYAVTIEQGNCHILAYRHDGVAWGAFPVIKGSTYSLLMAIV